ncbi:MAG: ABC transporter ATP-binding protein [Chloroflexota bacterium]
MSDSPAAIRIEGLVKRYGEREVLAGVSLDVAAGTIVALLGPNGAGKTTTVEIVEGYRTADNGRVEVLGIDPGRGGPALRARVGIMLQGGGIDPRARPLELLRFFAALHDGADDPDRLLDTVGLGTVASTPYRRLSGGERQRLALGLALVGRPEVLILDEPTAGMDQEAKRATRSLVAALRDEGLAILLTTHDLADVERLADRVAILHEGRIVAQGSLDEITSAPPGGRDIRIRTEPELDPAGCESLASTLGPGVSVVDDGAAGPGRQTIVGTQGDPPSVAAIATWAAVHGVQLVELRVATASLEDRYFELTGTPSTTDATTETAR